MTARALALLAVLAACTPGSDVGLGVDITPDGVSPSVRVSGAGISIDAGDGVSIGLDSGVVGVTVAY
jgi:hypothetical protein